LLNIVLFLWQVILFSTGAGGQGSAANLAWVRSRVAAHTPPNAPPDGTEEEARAFSNSGKNPPRIEKKALGKAAYWQTIGGIMPQGTHAIWLGAVGGKVSSLILA